MLDKRQRELERQVAALQADIKSLKEQVAAKDRELDQAYDAELEHTM